jgi:hypothetical protein
VRARDSWRARALASAGSIGEAAQHRSGIDVLGKTYHDCEGRRVCKGLVMDPLDVDEVKDV